MQLYFTMGIYNWGGKFTASLSFSYCTDTLTQSSFCFNSLSAVPFTQQLCTFFHISSSTGHKTVAGSLRPIDSKPYNSLVQSSWQLNCSGYNMVSVGQGMYLSFPSSCNSSCYIPLGAEKIKILDISFLWLQNCSLGFVP